MKYIKRVLIFCLMLIAVGITKSNATTGTITYSDGVRMRKSPSTDAEIVTYLSKSAEVEIIEETNGWYKVKYTATGNYTGYIRADMLEVKNGGTVPTSATTQTATATPTTAPTTAPVETTPTTVASPEPQASEEVKKSDLIGDKKLINNSNLYILPVITSSVKGTVNRNTTVTVLEVAGNFAYIKYNGQTGWIRVANIDVGQSTNGNSGTYTSWTGYVNIEEAIVRSKATTSSDMVTSFKRNKEITIVGEEGDFYMVVVGDIQGYMAKFLISDSVTTTNRGTERTSTPEPVQEETTSEVVTTKTENTTVAQAETKTEPTTTTQTVSETTAVPTSSVGDKIAQMAKSYVGYKYVYGGASPSSGFDCSGLVYYICGQLGYSVNRTADYQINNGVAVDKSELQPGDLVFFTNYQTNTGIGHVGIYIGNNQFVHASTTTTGVIISSLTSAEYTRRYVGARRIGV